MNKINTAYFEGQIDMVPRESLQPYDGEKQFWIVVTSPTVALAEVATKLMMGDDQQLQDWVTQRQVQIHASLGQIAGDRFRAIWFEDAYVIQSC
ncbi:hypothetical protein ACQ4M4_10745 [Leptolyngbya sp. AN02str]|uniref:hypothetical protein n=1 Tax=Leptolyngbya sp. AN02str TaxID=3423363 RepID=UPI003D318929